MVTETDELVLRVAPFFLLAGRRTADELREARAASITSQRKSLREGRPMVSKPSILVIIFHAQLVYFLSAIHTTTASRTIAGERRRKPSRRRACCTLKRTTVDWGRASPSTLLSSDSPKLSSVQRERQEGKNPLPGTYRYIPTRSRSRTPFFAFASCTASGQENQGDISNVDVTQGPTETACCGRDLPSSLPRYPRPPPFPPTTPAPVPPSTSSCADDDRTPNTSHGFGGEGCDDTSSDGASAERRSSTTRMPGGSSPRWSAEATCLDQSPISFRAVEQTHKNKVKVYTNSLAAKVYTDSLPRKYVPLRACPGQRTRNNIKRGRALSGHSYEWSMGFRFSGTDTLSRLHSFKSQLIQLR